GERQEWASESDSSFHLDSDSDSAFGADPEGLPPQATTPSSTPSLNMQHVQTPSPAPVPLNPLFHESSLRRTRSQTACLSVNPPSSSSKSSSSSGSSFSRSSRELREVERLEREVAHLRQANAGLIEESASLRAQRDAAQAHAVFAGQQYSLYKYRYNEKTKKKDSSKRVTTSVRILTSNQGRKEIAEDSARKAEKKKAEEERLNAAFSGSLKSMTKNEELKKHPRYIGLFERIRKRKDPPTGNDSAGSPGPSPMPDPKPSCRACQTADERLHSDTSVTQGPEDPNFARSVADTRSIHWKYLTKVGFTFKNILNVAIYLDFDLGFVQNKKIPDSDTFVQLDPLNQVLILLAVICHLIIGLSIDQSNFIVQSAILCAYLGIGDHHASDLDRPFSPSQNAIISDMPKNLPDALKKLDVDGHFDFYAICPSCSFSNKAQPLKGKKMFYDFLDTCLNKVVGKNGISVLKL
ncbi:hypothetical protein F5050DRAFT_1872356, partial [Lentinula boryana]